MQLEFNVTAQPKAKKERQAFERPYFSLFWEWHETKYCFICGVTETRTGSICKYCQSQFPIK